MDDRPHFQILPFHLLWRWSQVDCILRTRGSDSDQCDKSEASQPRGDSHDRKPCILMTVCIGRAVSLGDYEISAVERGEVDVLNLITKVSRRVTGSDWPRGSSRAC
jgi:hypothetical protein